MVAKAVFSVMTTMTWKAAWNLESHFTLFFFAFSIPIIVILIVLFVSLVNSIFVCVLFTFLTLVRFLSQLPFFENLKHL